MQRLDWQSFCPDEVAFSLEAALKADSNERTLPAGNVVVATGIAQRKLHTFKSLKKKIRLLMF